MPAKHRDNPMTASTVLRVYRLSKSLRAQMNQVRTARAETIREFIETAVGNELPKITKGLDELGISPMGGDGKPTRLPLSDAILDQLRAAAETTGLPGTLLIAACLRLSAGRKRVRKVAAKSGGVSTECGSF